MEQLLLPTGPKALRWQLAWMRGQCKALWGGVKVLEKRCQLSFLRSVHFCSSSQGSKPSGESVKQTQRVPIGRRCFQGTKNASRWDHYSFTQWWKAACAGLGQSDASVAANRHRPAAPTTSKHPMAFSRGESVLPKRTETETGRARGANRQPLGHPNPDPRS